MAKGGKRPGAGRKSKAEELKIAEKIDIISMPKKVGRPTKYDPKYSDQGYKLSLLGATDKEMADFFEVTESTLNLWKLEHPGFSESLKRGKVEADSNVGARLYERAMGFEHDSEEIKVISTGKYQSEIERVPIRKIYPPDVTAAIFWLKNRQSDKWRDKHEINHSGEISTITGMVVK